MTNYEAMRIMNKDELVEFLLSIRMNKDELVEFLSSIVDRGAIRIMDKDALTEFLSSIADCKKCPALEKFCDGQRDCVDAILNWLNAESDDDTDTVVEHSEGQPIHISHAEVMYETKQLNPGLSAGLVQPGTRIIVPCQQAER